MDRRLRRGLTRAGLGALSLLALLVIGVRLLYGGGEPYVDISTDPVLPAASVEQLGSLPFPAGNVAVSASGRVFVNIHPFVSAHRFTNATLFEWTDGEAVPYPDLATQSELRFVFGMTVDAQDRLWLTSPATLDRDQSRLQAFDLTTGERLVDHRFPEGVGRFAQDIRITPDGATALLADTGAFRFTNATLLVVDLETMATRSLLGGHPSTQPEDWMIQTAEGDHTIAGGLITFSVGLDGITLSPDGEDLYFATMSHDTLYRVPLAAVLDEALSAAELEAQVEAVAPKPLSDGITVSAQGEVLITDVEHGAIVGIRPDGTTRTLVRLGATIGWTDGVAVGPEGRVYFTDSQIPRYLDPLLRPPTRERLDAWAPHAALYSFRLPE